MKKIVFLFPGQGSQALGMGKSLYDSFEEARAVFEQGSEALGLDLKKLCFDSSEDELKKTENTQPAILTASIAALRVLENQVPLLKPSFVAGHSVGEYTALVASGVLDFPTALRAVRLRGWAMQESVPLGEGGMVAGLGLQPQWAKVICEEVNKNLGPDSLSAANFNAPGQIVLSGRMKAIEQVSEIAAKIDWSKHQLEAPGRIKWIKLEVSAPFHSPLMRPAQEKMSEFFSSINFPDAQVPVVQNLTAQTHSLGSEIKANLVAQVSGPVRWEESIRLLADKGCEVAFELGHGQVLKGLHKKILSNEADQFSFWNLGSKADFEALTKDFRHESFR